ncbi:MAG: DoxX family protein [Lysobacterales bacterium]
MTGLIQTLQGLIAAIASFLASISLRIYLAPIFILAGGNKLANPEGVAQWFASLGLPAPELMVYLAGGTEFIGGWMLLLGIAVRWIAIPLMFTMVVAATTAHWENGWHVAPETELTAPWEWRDDLIESGVERRDKARSLLRRHGNYSYLTEAGAITINKNGIEWAATYFLMLMALVGLGGGKFLSVDYWIGRFFKKE